MCVVCYSLDLEFQVVCVSVCVSTDQCHCVCVVSGLRWDSANAITASLILTFLIGPTATGSPNRGNKQQSQLRDLLQEPFLQFVISFDVTEYRTNISETAPTADKMVLPHTAGRDDGCHVIDQVTETPNIKDAGAYSSQQGSNKEIDTDDIQQRELNQLSIQSYSSSAELVN